MNTPLHAALLAATFVVAMTTAACSQAQPPQSETASTRAASPAKPKAATAKLPPAVQALEGQGLQVMGEFEAPGGLRAFAGMARQQPVSVFLTPDGQHAIVGTLLDANGNEAATDQLQKLVAGPMTQQTWAKLEAAKGVVRDGEDSAPRVVYTFTDANCPYCHAFWKAARPWVDSGKVQLRHVMVGIIKEDSPAKAAAILAAASPGKALDQHERTKDQGGIKPLARIPADVQQQLQANQLLMLELGFQGTPGILFKDKDGMLQRRAGLPQGNDLSAVLGPR